MATEVKKRTLYPAYYQTLVFDNITIPEIDNFRYAPILSFRLYDEASARLSVLVLLFLIQWKMF